MLLTASFALACLAPGCLGGTSLDLTFDEGMPNGWVPQGGSWRVTRVEGEGNLLEARGERDPGLSSLVLESKTFKRFEIQLRMGILSGSDPQGLGVVVGWKDPANYVILRYSTHEHGWHLFTVVDGVRTKDPNATLPGGTDPGYNRWIGMRAHFDGSTVRVYDQDREVLQQRIAASGKIGLFVRGDTRAYFDDVSVRG